MSSSLAARRGASAATASLRGLTTNISNLSIAHSSAASTAHAATAPTPTPPPPRSFSTTTPRPAKTFGLHLVAQTPIPPYPYGPRRVYKQSNNGLYGTSRIRTGHNISEDNKVKSLRTWKPNIHRKRFWSEALGAHVRTRTTTRVLRTVRKEGGVDNYVLKSKAARIKDLGPGGWKLRWLVMHSRSMQEKFAADKAELVAAQGGEGAAAADAAADAESPVAPNQDLVNVLIDAATPGPLNSTSRKVLQDRSMQIAAMQMARQWAEDAASGEEFMLGDEDGLGLDGDDAIAGGAGLGVEGEEAFGEGEEAAAFDDGAEDVAGFPIEGKPPSVVTEAAIRDAFREHQAARLEELARQQERP